MVDEIRESAIDVCYRAAKRYKQEKSLHPNETITMKLECFNKEEAMIAKEYMKTQYLDIPFFVTWLEFG